MRTFGSGRFGHWITDEAGLPAYEYTCNHLADPEAEYAMPRGKSRQHFHLLGNLHVSAIAHNEGLIEFFRPDTVGSWLNRYAPQWGAYAGGFGFLRMSGNTRSTLYRHLSSPMYRRMWGVGYFRKSAPWGDLTFDQVAFIPYGEDPVLIHLTTLGNRGLRPLTVSYVEYWDVLVSPVLPGRGERSRMLRGLRVRRTTRYCAERRLLLCCPAGSYPGPGASDGARDPDPPTIFLAAIDGLPVAGYETSRSVFFGEGGLEAPDALQAPFLACNTFREPTRADRIVLTLQREVTIPPRYQVALAHLYGCASWDAARRDASRSATPLGLVERYSSRPPQAWFQQSLESWRESIIRLHAPDDPWLAREVAWASYYGQALTSYSAATGEAFFDQGGSRTYALGLPCSPRDSCQHGLALLPNSPAQVRSTVRHLARLPSVSGAQSPGHSLLPWNGARRESADQHLWLLWLIAEYALWYRDRAFVDQELPRLPRIPQGSRTVREQVHSSLDLVQHAMAGHGLLRLMQELGDRILSRHRRRGDDLRLRADAASVATGALAGVVLPRVAELYRWLGEGARAEATEQFAARVRLALSQAWNGRWFGQPAAERGHANRLQPPFLECQPWVLLAGAASEAQRVIVLHDIGEQLPLGARGDGTLDAWDRVPFADRAPLVCALAQTDPLAAWETLKSCTLATHAEAHPERWYGIWSGPHSLAEVARRRARAGTARLVTHFPIADAHSATHLLYAARQLVDLQADARGYRLRLRLPFETLGFEAARVGVRWEPHRVTGYIVPQGNDSAEVRVEYGRPFAGQPRVLVNGRRVAGRLSADAGEVSFSVFLRGGQRTDWEIVAEPEE